MVETARLADSGLSLPHKAGGSGGVQNTNIPAESSLSATSSSRIVSVAERGAGCRRRTGAPSASGRRSRRLEVRAEVDPVARCAKSVITSKPESKPGRLKGSDLTRGRRRCRRRRRRSARRCPRRRRSSSAPRAPEELVAELVADQRSSKFVPSITSISVGLLVPVAAQSRSRCARSTSMRSLSEP